MRFNVDVLTTSEKYSVTMSWSPNVIKSKPVNSGGVVSAIKSVAFLADPGRMASTSFSEVSSSAMLVNDINVLFSFVPKSITSLILFKSSFPSVIFTIVSSSSVTIPSESCTESLRSSTLL